MEIQQSSKKSGSVDGGASNNNVFGTLDSMHVSSQNSSQEVRNTFANFLKGAK